MINGKNDGRALKTVTAQLGWCRMRMIQSKKRWRLVLGIKNARKSQQNGNKNHSNGYNWASKRA